MAANKLERLEVRVPAAEKRLYALAAARFAETVSEFVRRAARCEAERALVDEPTIRLSADEAARFLDPLDADAAGAHSGLADLRSAPSAFAG